MYVVRVLRLPCNCLHSELCQPRQKSKHPGRAYNATLTLTRLILFDSAWLRSTPTDYLVVGVDYSVTCRTLYVITPPHTLLSLLGLQSTLGIDLKPGGSISPCYTTGHKCDSISAKRDPTRVEPSQRVHHHIAVARNPLARQAPAVCRGRNLVRLAAQCGEYCRIGWKQFVRRTPGKKLQQRFPQLIVIGSFLSTIPLQNMIF